MSVLLVGMALAFTSQFALAPVQAKAVSSQEQVQKPLSGRVPGCYLKGKKLWGNVYAVNYSYQADVKIYQTNTKYQSDLIVWPTKYSYQATKCGMWNFVNYSYQANLKVFFVKYSYQADFQVFFTNYSYQAGTN